MLDAALSLVGVSPQHALRLPSLPSMLGRGKAFRHYPPDVLQRAQIECERFSPLTARPDPEFHQPLISVHGMDDTDAILYATLARNPAWLLLSGDKRAMKALSNEPGLATVREAVAGRVVCLEHILSGLLGSHQSGFMCDAFRPVRPINKTVAVVLSDANGQDHAACLDAADRYLVDIRDGLSVGFLFSGEVPN